MSSRKARKGILTPSIFLFLWIFFCVAEPLRASKFQAEERLLNAIEDYRRGDFQGAKFRLITAVDADSEWIQANADYHKLKMFLLLSENQRTSAMRHALKSVKIRPDSFLYYLLGSYNLQAKYPRQAANSYLAAVKMSATSVAGNDVTGNDATGNDADRILDSRPLYSQLPFYCPEEELIRDVRNQSKTDSTGLIGSFEEEWLSERRTNIFRDAARAEELWGRTLHPLEKVSASYQALTIFRKLEKGKSYVQVELEDYIQKTVSDAYFSNDRFKNLKALLRDPESSQNHKKCILAAKNQWNRINSFMTRGRLYPERLDRSTIRFNLMQLYKNRIAWDESVKSRYSYGVFLVQERQFLAALHLYRNIISTELKNTPGEILPEDASILLAAYRQLQRSYRGLNRLNDADAVAALASVLESVPFLQEPNRSESPDRKKLSEKFVAQSSSFPGNRECLIILIRNAEIAGNLKDQSRYRALLKKRDREKENSEFLISSDE